MYSQVTQHENSAIYTLLVRFAQHLTKNGPAKSIPTLEKGAASLTRNSGEAATRLTLQDFPFSLLHFQKRNMLDQR